MMLIKMLWYYGCGLVIGLLLPIVCLSYRFEDQVHCAIRKDISPCTCHNYLPKEESEKLWIQVVCQKMNSFAQVVQILQNKFDRSVNIMLSIEYSNLDDMSTNRFKDIKSDINVLKMEHNQLTNISDYSFEGISDVKYLSLADNKISEFPGVIFKHMPNIETLEVSRTLIKYITPKHFESLQSLKSLFFSECNLTYIQNGTFPSTLTAVNLGSNNLTTLNQNLRFQKKIGILHIPNNHIKSLEGELPDQVTASKLFLLNISGNEIDHLPQSFRNLTYIKHFFASGNKLSSLDNTLEKMSRMEDLDISENQIRILYRTDFSGTILNRLTLAHNEIANLNGSLLPLINLTNVDITYNKLTELPLSEFEGLFKLDKVELSHNKISKVIGFEPTLKLKTHIEELDLAHNEIETLEGSLGSVIGLSKLNISYNKLRYLPSQFLEGMVSLQILDISHNFLRSLEDTSKAILPSLAEIMVTHNELTTLGQDFHGFPTLCWANLTYNKIRTIKPEFGEKTQCKLHGVNSILRIHLDGNTILCDDSMKEVMKLIQIRNNSVEFHGSTQCSSPKEELKYNVTNSDSSPITVITLDKK